MYISHNGTNIHPPEGKMEDIFLKYEYKTKKQKTIKLKNLHKIYHNNHLK